MKTVDNRQSARIVGLEFGFAPLSAHSGDGHPSKPQALVPWVVAMATGALVGGVVVATGNLICRWREYCLRRREIAFNISAHIMEMPEDEGEAAAEGTREVLRYLGEPGDTLGQRARGFIVAGSFRFYRAVLGGARGTSTVAINCLGNFGDQIKRMVHGFHRAAVGIVKANNKPFTRKPVFRIFGRHKDSSSVVGLDDSTMDEAGGSGNAATSRVEVLRGQCGEKGFVDLGAPFAQRTAEAEMLAPNGSPKEENSRQSRLFFAALTVLLDWTPEGKSILRVSGAFARNYLNGFWVHMAGQPGVYAHFAFLGSIRGEMLFSVDEWRPETDQQLCPPSPLLRLRGPFQKGPSDDL